MLIHSDCEHPAKVVGLIVAPAHLLSLHDAAAAAAVVVPCASAVGVCAGVLTADNCLMAQPPRLQPGLLQ